MENPFSCSMANCSLSFDTEDQLSAHQKKHELSLSLTPSAYKNPFLLDQTPTPIQFLSPNSLELQDFQSDNPFDATFRKANSSNCNPSNFLIPESSSFIASLPDSEVLNTPSIILPSEPATPISLKPFPKKLSLKAADNHQCCENADSLPFSPNEETEKTVAPEADAELPSESANFSPITSSFEVLSENENKEKKDAAAKQVLQTSVITSVGNTAILRSTAGMGVPTAVVVTRSPVNSISTLSTSQVSVVAQSTTNQIKVQKSVPSVVQPLCVGTVLLSINLADGQIVQLPVVSNNQPTTVASIAPQVSSITTTTSPNAKTKLKEVLMQNQRSGSVEKKSNSTSKGKHKSSSVHILPDSTNNSSHMSSSPPSSPLQPTRPHHTGRKRRDTFDNPDEKRKRSLERNRAAATRCREKKKMWITALEKKADEMEQINMNLQNEVTVLRNEVAHLKTLLLAHKDCPVTLQQRAIGHEAEKETYTTVHIITSDPNDNQRVPTGLENSPLDPIEMEMEVCSVHGGSSESSLASDMSETSYRER